LNTDEIIKKYSTDKDHGKNVEKLSILLFQKIKPYFPDLEIYDNEKCLNLLKKGALLHDIGIAFEKMYDTPHHKAGAKFVYENKPDDVEENLLPLLCCIIRYHRKSMPKIKHKFYKILNDEQKKMADIFSAIVRFSDSLDYLHIGLLEDFVTVYDKELKLLTFVFTNNIISERSFMSAIEKKKDLFEKVFQVKIRLKGS